MDMFLKPLTTDKELSTSLEVGGLNKVWADNDSETSTSGSGSGSSSSSGSGSSSSGNNKIVISYDKDVKVTTITTTNGCPEGQSKVVSTVTGTTVTTCMAGGSQPCTAGSSPFSNTIDGECI